MTDLDLAERLALKSDVAEALMLRALVAEVRELRDSMRHVVRITQLRDEDLSIDRYYLLGRVLCVARAALEGKSNE